MELETLKDLNIHELKDLYSAENQLLKALPEMAKAATNRQLAKGFTDHLAQTEAHAVRLETILESEMAGYGCARTYAELLGDSKGAKTLQITLDEEAVTDQRLTKLAKSTINLEAVRVS